MKETQQTSLDALHGSKEKRKNHKHKIIEFLYNQRNNEESFTGLEIAKGIGINYNAVMRRMGELVSYEKIEQVGVKKIQDTNYNTYKFKSWKGINVIKKPTELELLIKAIKEICPKEINRSIYVKYKQFLKENGL